MLRNATPSASVRYSLVMWVMITRSAMRPAGNGRRYRLT